MIVMKFGGTSVGGGQRIREVATIVAASSRSNQIVVVVSAMSTVTNLLVEAAGYAVRKDRAALLASVKTLHTMHLDAARDLGLEKAAEETLVGVIEVRLAALTEILHSVYALAELTPRASDLIVSFGERLSIHLVAAAVVEAGVSAEAVEANRLIVTNDNFTDAKPFLAESSKKAKPVIAKLLRAGVVPIVTGFMGATQEGTTATLGRGGSDYSATILGYCLDADEVWIWTDVDGVMTADPRIVKEAHTIAELSYSEAAELSYFGARVLHPLTMVPASLKRIPIRIKNTFNPAGDGTLISGHTGTAKYAEKAISSTKKLALITVQGRGMIGAPGMAAKVFSAIAAHHINVLFISQASSEYNISLAVSSADGDATVHILRDTFAHELAEKYLEMITVEDDLAIVAVVGEGMKGNPGAAGRVFSAMGDAHVNVMAIAQGSSEHNISFMVAAGDVARAVQSLHNKFHLKSEGGV